MWRKRSSVYDLLCKRGQVGSRLRLDRARSQDREYKDTVDRVAALQANPIVHREKGA